MRIGGTVVRGSGRGRSLGFPTANLDAVPDPRWAHGLYVVRARLDGGPAAQGIMNIGVRPTFRDPHDPVAEVHLLDHDGTELYGHRIVAVPMAFLAPERTFRDPAALAAHLARIRQAVADKIGAEVRRTDRTDLFRTTSTR